MFFRSSSFVLAAAIAAVAGCGQQASASAYFTPTEEVNEVMMEALGQTLLNATSVYGYGSLDSFSMYTYADPASGMFMYGTMPGATLNGAPLSISASGHGDLASRSYDWSTSISVGMQSSLEGGSITIDTAALRNGSPDDNESGDSNCTIDGHAGTRGPIKWKGEGDNTTSSATFTYVDDKNVTHIVKASDKYIGNGQWQWVIGALAGGNVGINNVGFSDPATGMGSVSVSIGSSVVPTPGATVLVAAAGVTGLRRRRR